MWNTKKNQYREVIEKLTLERLELHRTASRLAKAVVYALSAIEADKGKPRGSKVTVARIEGYLRSALDELSKQPKYGIKSKTISSEGKT